MTAQRRGERDILRLRVISDSRLSPDGSRLAFLSTREREWASDLYVLDMSGGEPERVAELPRGITELEWFDRSLRAEVSS